MLLFRKCCIVKECPCWADFEGGFRGRISLFVLTHPPPLPFQLQETKQWSRFRIVVVSHSFKGKNWFGQYFLGSAVLRVKFLEGLSEILVRPLVAKQLMLILNLCGLALCGAESDVMGDMSWNLDRPNYARLHEQYEKGSPWLCVIHLCVRCGSLCVGCIWQKKEPKTCLASCLFGKKEGGMFFFFLKRAQHIFKDNRLDSFHFFCQILKLEPFFCFVKQERKRRQPLKRKQVGKLNIFKK